MKSIFATLDFRTYLLEFYQEHKTANARFSWRVLSKKAGFTSPVFLKLVSEGKRNLGDASIDQVGEALELKDKELVFWHHLVLFNQANTAYLKQEHYLILRGMTGSIREFKIQQGFFDYYRFWYMPAIRELVTLYSFGMDFEKLGLSLIPSISATEAKNAVQTLERIGMIQKNKKGQWEQTQKAISSGTATDRLALLQYHKEMLRLSGDALDRFEKDDRFVSGMTLGVSKSCYDAILAETEAFRNRVLQLVHGDPHSDQVVQFSVQMVPMGAIPGHKLLQGKRRKI